MFCKSDYSRKTTDIPHLMQNLLPPRLPDWWRYNRREECQEGQWQKHHLSEDPSWYQHHMSLWKGRHIETSSLMDHSSRHLVRWIIHHREAAVWYSGFSQSLILPPALWALLRKARLSWGKVSLYWVPSLLRQKRDWMVLARARCSNWPSLPHGQLRPVLSPETIASQTCRVCADPLTGVQDLLVGEQLCHKFVAYKESVHLKQRHHMPGRHVASRLLPGSMSIGGN